MKLMLSQVAVGAAAVALAAFSTTAVTASADDAAQLYVVQGLPAVSADISIDGAVVASGVAAAKVIGPLSVKPGNHTVTISGKGTQLASATAEVSAGDSMDLVVHLPTDPRGAAVVTAYDNDISSVPRGKARLAVAHTAAVGPADIRVDGKVLFANVANGEELSLVVPAATYAVQIVPAGRTTPSVLGPLDLSVTAGGLNRVYAIGDPSTTTMTVAAHVITTAESGSASPGRVDSGVSGAAAVSTRSALQSAAFFTG